MRYLNKIIFINSAHIPLGEVQLDGNINLMGNQGVGKSTILRAILFFYTATTESSKLGIARGKLSFTDFYFESPNSYIVYEVVRDDSYYTVAAMLLQGRVVFRFIDAPYSKDWFFDENDVAYSSWGDIITKIGKNIAKETVENYETYRDIIYGNRRAIHAKMYKYAIAESEKYQNIPRVIRNVFLNAELRSSDIKHTIINSIGEDVPPVNLNRMRSEVQDFDRDYDDLSLWFAFNKQGNVPTRVEAAEIDMLLRNHEDISESIKNSIEKLNYAYNHAKKELPKLQVQINTLSDKKDKYTKQLNEQQEKFEDKKDKLNQLIGKLKGYLDDIKKAKAHYEQIGIQQIISDCELEPIVQAKKEETLKRRDILTRQYQDVETKYKQLIQQTVSAKTTLVQKEEAAFQGMREAAFAQKEDIRSNERRECDVAAEHFDGELAQIETKIKELLTCQAGYSSDLKHLKKDDFYRDERRQDQDSLNMTSTQVETNNLKLLHVQEDIDKIRSEYKKLFSELEDAQKQELEQARRQLDTAKTAIEQLLQRIATLDRTFYGWLETNKPDWRENIGKVVREEDVLFAESLNPTLGEQKGTSLFGVNIDIANSDYRPTDSDALKANLKASQEAFENQKAEFSKLPIKHDEQQDKLRKEYKRDLKKKEDEKLECQKQEFALSAEIRRLNLSINQLDEQATAAYEAKKTELEKQITDIEQSIISIDKEKESIKNSKQRKLSSIKREHQNQIEEIDADLEAKKQAKEDAIKAYEIDCNKQLQAIRHDREKELSNKGVDTLQLDSIEQEIKLLDAQLKEIEDKKKTVLEYNIKCHDLLNHEAKYKHDLQKNNGILEKEKKEYDDKRSLLTNRRNDTASLLDNAQERFDSLQIGISKTDEIRLNNFYAELHVDTELESEDNCSDLCESIRSQYLNRSHLIDTIKSKAVKFKGKFKAPDRFGFEMTLASDKDFLSLATKISDFYQEEQYETYRNQVERTYAQIISVIAQEVDRINENKSKVQETILAINRDFAEKTFAGVIKLIKLEVKEEPDDPLMNVLRRIAEFVENNEGVAMSNIPMFACLTNDKANREAVDLLKALTNQLHTDTRREELTLADVFKLRFTIQENDKLYEHVENLANIGSDGTDVLVKAIINIMLISVFKTKARSKNDSYFMHCMMDEINRLHPSNIQGILQFASKRNIWIVNACPMTFNVGDYRHTYILEKDDDSYTHINLLIDNDRT